MESNVLCHEYNSERCGGLMVSALDSGTSGPGSSPGREHRVVFLGKTLPLSTHVYKWVPVNFMLGVTLRLSSIPSKGEGIRNTPSHFMLQKPG